MEFGGVTSNHGRHATICPCHFTAAAAAAADDGIAATTASTAASADTAATIAVFASTPAAFWFLVVAPLLPLFPLPLPAPPLPLLSAGHLQNHCPYSCCCCHHCRQRFFCRRHHFLSDSTAHRQRICCADTPYVSAAAAPLPLSPMPSPTLFPPRQPPLPKIANLLVGRCQSPDASFSLDTHIVGSRVGGFHLKFSLQQPYTHAISLFFGATIVKQYLRCTLHNNHSTMINQTPGVPMPKAMINRPNTVKLLDPDDPNDNAFKLVITFVFCCDVYFSKKNSIFGPSFTIPPRPILH